MNRKKGAWLVCLCVAFVLLYASFPWIPHQITHAFSKQTVYVGSSGPDVKEMQGRLKFLGFYTGKVDGVFSWRTYNALRNFQYEFGLKIDGILGPKTKLKLWQATKNWRPGPGETAASSPSPKPSEKLPKTNMALSKNELKIMANAVYGEARGEPYIGQVAVAAVILNRTKSPSFPDSPSAVIFEPGAFTAVADGQIWLPPNKTAEKAVQDALNGWDPTGGALYYFNPDTATSPWIWTRPQIKKIGKHIFCK
ncbi:spore cortex-lytic enzyme [Aneurinibacillus thermoaerophilus]|uniref:spore cortex-lytic enzyme n=1 Tax=Aneurinibacillus thermoaerophilus TaxID=143495 RepID=UPI002E20CF07|nr:spore cortex-lytic enzyme [Aneurinibacillus thermoaerophilus]MED0675664.1 spore cortex-lytic enzyme [Aneurinibacillus thermoaerophilus]